MVTLYGCSTDEECIKQLTTTDAINFGAIVNTNSTRALGTITDLTATSFGVFGCQTGPYRYGASNINPDFMYNTKVYYDGYNWTYSPLKYWPNGEGDTTTDSETPYYVSFFAYAPYSDGNENTAEGYCIPAISTQNEQGNPWLVYRLHTNIAEQVDLLWAKPLIDQTKASSTLTMEFQHALACVGDEITIDLSNTKKEALKALVTTPVTAVSLQLTDITINYTLTEKGKLTLWSSGETPNWQTVINGSPTISHEVTLMSEGNWNLFTYDGNVEALNPVTYTDRGIFYIPIEQSGYPQTVTIFVKYKTICTGGDTLIETSTKQIRLSSYTNSYQPGRKMDLNISL